MFCLSAGSTQPISDTFTLYWPDSQPSFSPQFGQLGCVSITGGHDRGSDGLF